MPSEEKAQGSAAPLPSSRLSARISPVTPDHLRFDYPFDRGLTPDETSAIEQEVRRIIREDRTVTPEHMSMGEAQAAGRLAEAAGVMSTQPAALQLRYLQTLSEIAMEHNSTIIFPVPVEMMEAFMSFKGKKE